MAFDMGAITPSSVSASLVCLSHGHLDHCGAVGMHASRRQLTGAQPATYVCHPDMVLPLQDIFGAYRRLSESLLPAVITPLTAGEQAVQLDSGGHPCKVHEWDGTETGLALLAKGPTKFLTAFATAHRVPSQGYIIWEQHCVLKEAYRALPSKEVGALRKSQPYEALFDVTVTPLVVFSGDTTLPSILRCGPALRAPLLILEATSLDDGLPLEKCHRRGHVHISEVVEAAEALQGVGRLLLMHVSHRYSPSMAVALVAAALPPALHAKVWLSTAGLSGDVKHDAPPGTAACAGAGTGHAADEDGAHGDPHG